jgi:transposase
VKQPVENVTLSSEEGERLIAHVHQSNLPAAVASRLEQIIRTCLWLVFALQETKITVRRLRSLLFGKSLKPSPGSAASSESRPEGGDEASADTVVPADADDGARTSGEPPPQSAQSPERAKPKGGHRPGTGRLGAEAYVGAERVECHHEELAAGQRCPVCGQGTLYDLPPGVEMRIDGHALLSAMRYELQKLRCSACGQVFTAPLPAEAGEGKYSARARAVLAVSRFYLGLPLYRVEGYQAMLGVPMPDATQWDQIERVADCAYKVFAQLEVLAAQGELIYQDDTAVRILALLVENRHLHAHAAALGLARAPERTGMYTTALVVKVGDHTIYLYYSGRAHAGENLEALLTKREATHEKPLVMSDALHSNDADETMLIRCHCLAHGRRKFSELEDVFPQECAVVLDVLRQVFDHEEETRVQQRSAQERLVYHQVYSGPLMEGLKRWLLLQVDDRLVEPNSSLGKAIAYLLGHWDTLTRFLSVPGAPLENNLVERALKLFIRQRKNSLFFATEHSAYIASVLTSLIATCLAAGVNALEYLVALQEHRSEVFTAPEAWLPWTYHARLAPP